MSRVRIPSPAPNSARPPLTPMKNFIALFLLPASFAFGQYKMESAGAPPADVAFAAVLQPQGYKISGPGGAVYCEVWFRSQLVAGPKSTDDAVTLTIPQGTLLGVIRFAGP